LAQHVSKPRRLDLNEALRIIKYLVATKNLKLKLYDESHKNVLLGYADADWASDRSDRKSISGYICAVFGGTVSWSSKKQKTVALSTTEAEYYALTEAATELEWLRRVLLDFDIQHEGPLQMFSDNQSTIAIINNRKFSMKLRHMDTRLKFVIDWAIKKLLEVKSTSRIS
jgi:hypothetical protein